MGFPIAPVIMGGASLLGNALGAASTARQNRLSREFSEHMYNRQREDSLADWARNNDYNSPTASMQRLREAGLNPNLIYDNGSGAAGVSAPIRSADVSKPNFESNRWDLSGLGNSMASYYDAKVKEAQTDNLRKQNTVLDEEIILKKAQAIQTYANTANTQQQTATSKFQLSQSERLKDISAQAAEANLNQMLANTQYTLDNNQRAALSNTQSIAESVSRILTMEAGRAKTTDERKQIQALTNNASLDAQLKELDIQLKKKGIQPTDGIIPRIAATVLENIRNEAGIKSPKETIQNIKSNIRKAKSFIDNKPAGKAMLNFAFPNF